MPHQTFGSGSSEDVIFQTDHTLNVNFASKGTLEDFQQLSKLALGNDWLLFALSVAFAPPLLYPLDMENGGFNLVGPSSIGKTRLLKAATSVWGPPESIHQWRATSNGLEGVAQLHNDILLCLDELGQISAKDLGSTVYMIGNGAPKSRGKKEGGIRKQLRWRLIYLSSGEIGIVEHMRSANQQARAGQEVRTVDIQIGSRPYGCFDCLHQLSSGSEFSHHISQLVSNCYGVAGCEFLSRLTESKDDVCATLQKVITQLKEKYVPKNACGQVTRVFDRFALVAAAGELATTFGITGWEEGAATIAAINLFNLWLEDRGDVGVREEQRILEQVSLFFEQHGSYRFIDVDELDTRVPNCAGYRQKLNGRWEFYVYPEAYKKDICNGFNPKFVTEVCSKAGILVMGSSREACPTWRPPGEQSRRFYHFNASVLPQLKDGSY